MWPDEFRLYTFWKTTFSPHVGKQIGKVGTATNWELLFPHLETEEEDEEGDPRGRLEDEELAHRPVHLDVEVMRPQSRRNNCNIQLLGISY